MVMTVPSAGNDSSKYAPAAPWNWIRMENRRASLAGAGAALAGVGAALAKAARRHRAVEMPKSFMVDT